jgi:methylated-DNA-protein-cysteine methyltransferase-like protein
VKEKRGEASARPLGFFAAVYAMVRRIPKGKVATYGQVARLVGAPRHARVVGWAMRGNRQGGAVPCHRVIQQGGSLSPSYCPGDPGRQRRLLEREGVAFLLDGRVDLAAHQWYPAASWGPGRMTARRASPGVGTEPERGRRRVR